MTHRLDKKKDSQTGFRFDFDRAVADARADFPETTKKIIFVDLASPQAPALLKQWLAAIDPASRGFFLATAGGEDSFIKAALRAKGFARRDDVSGCAVLAVHTEKNLVGHLEAEKGKYFTFYHELGHLVVPGAAAGGGASVETINRAEHAADIFALLWGMRDGILNAADAGGLSLTRAMNAACFKDMSHLTTVAVDALMVHQRELRPEGLSVQEIVRLAGAYADKHSLSAAEIRQCRRQLEKRHALGALARKIFRREKSGLAACFERVARTCRRAPEGSLAFYVSSRIVDEMLKKRDLSAGFEAKDVPVLRRRIALAAQKFPDGGKIFSSS